MPITVMYDASGTILSVSNAPEGGIGVVKFGPGERRFELDHATVEFDYPQQMAQADEEVFAVLDEIIQTHVVDVKADPPRVVKT
jgi:hypothetical protein